MGPERGHRSAPLRLRAGVDPGMRGAGQSDLVLEPSVLAIGIRRIRGDLLRHEPEVARDAEERDVARIPGELRMVVRVREDQVIRPSPGR